MLCIICVLQCIKSNTLYQRVLRMYQKCIRFEGCVRNVFDVFVLYYDMYYVFWYLSTRYIPDTTHNTFQIHVSDLTGWPRTNHTHQIARDVRDCDLRWLQSPQEIARDTCGRSREIVEIAISGDCSPIGRSREIYICYKSWVFGTHWPTFRVIDRPPPPWGPMRGPPRLSISVTYVTYPLQKLSFRDWHTVMGGSS